MATKPLATAVWHLKSLSSIHSISSLSLCNKRKFTETTSTMEALRMRLFFAMVIVLMAVSTVQNVSAADAPAPSPTSDATITFVPTVFASLVALAFALLF
ncbi:hypothetical protein REPUB_Repub16aG0090400 [Reevesia pubescens]